MLEEMQSSRKIADNANLQGLAIALHSLINGVVLMWLIAPNQASFEQVSRANREDILAFPPAASKHSLDYGSIKLPVVIAVGEDDPFAVAAQAERLKRDLPHAELVLLPEVAPMIPQNHPELVASLVHRLVSSKLGL